MNTYYSVIVVPFTWDSTLHLPHCCHSLTHSITVECSSTNDPMGGNGGGEGMDCSGRGNCDYTQGVCNCYKGFAGEMCEQINNFS